MPSPSFTILPDCSQPASVSVWHRTDMDDTQRKILLALYAQQPHSVDALGSTDTLDRMAAVYSAVTGVPTLPATLFAALVALRKSGSIASRRTPVEKPNFVRLSLTDDEKETSA